MPDEKCDCEKCAEYQKYLAWKSKQPKRPTPERMGELLDDYERDKRQLAEALETEPIHTVMLREIAGLKCRPQMVTTYTKSYVSGEFGDISKPLEFVTLKARDVELANLPLREIVHMVDDLREEIERYRMEHKPDTRHRFVPNKKYPWFCRDCGYPPEHPVMHLPAAAGLDSENADVQPRPDKSSTDQ